MKILITHPYCWPYVRRGSERFMFELARFLVQRGHDATLLSTSPEGREEEVLQGVKFVREPEISMGQLGRANLVRPESGFALVCKRFLGRNSFDVVHCLHHIDVLGKIWSSRGRRVPCVYHMTGIPFARWIRRHPWETAITHAAVRHASRVLVVSGYAARCYRVVFPETTFRPALPLAVPCDLRIFAPSQERDLASPAILFMGALTEARKGALPLAKAFSIVRKHFPSARLQYCGDDTPTVRASLLELIEPDARSGVEFLGRGKVEDLPRTYANAAVTVLPAVEEAFGMVLVESLAGGTPVVGSSDAGMTDIVEPGVGALFDPQPVAGVASNIDGLASAIIETLSLHRQNGLAARCVASAARFGWDRVGPSYERTYEECLNVQGVPA